MQEYSRILIEEYCLKHNSAKSRRLRKLVEMSYDLAAEGTDADSIFLERAIEQEKDPALKEALQDLDDLKAQFTQELAAAAPRDERTVEVARRMINAGKCPICSNQLVDSEDRGGNAMVRCTSCRYVVYGTIQEPKVGQK